MNKLAKRLYSRLGPLLILSLCGIAFIASFYGVVVLPLKQRSDALERRLESTARQSSAPSDYAGRAYAQLAAFYKFFTRSETVDEWLVKMYAVAKATGIELRAADYQLGDVRYGIERYRISLPVQGSYVQIRAFLEKVLLEVPIMSLDQATFRRKKINDGRIDADLTLTLYMRAP